jgi:hypothetical protein
VFDEDGGNMAYLQNISIPNIHKNLPLETIARVTELATSKLEGFANEELQQLQAGDSPA